MNLQRGLLGEFLPIKYGKSLPEKLRDSTGSHPVFGSSGRVGVHSSPLTSGPTLVIGRKGNVGAVHYSTVPCWPIDTAYYVEGPTGHNLRYYKYLLESLNLARLDRSTAIPGLSRDDYNAVEVAIAPPGQQDEIVAEIEKQFSRLDEAVAGLKRVKANLKRYKAAILKAAVEGRLVASPNEFGHLPLSNLIGPIHQGWSPRCDLHREPEPDEWAVITTTAVQPMQYVDGQGKPLPDGLEPRPHLEVRNGDFLVTRKGPRIRSGVACLVRGTRRRLMVCDTVYRFRCDESKVVPEYLEIALNSPSVVTAIDRQKAGINESGVSLTHAKLGGIEIPVPSLEKQSAIVAEVDRLLSIAREAEAEAGTNLKRAQALRQSILASHFPSAALG